MIKTKKYYSKESKKLPSFVYNAAYKCTECLGQPVYFKNDICPYPSSKGRYETCCSDLDATRAVGIAVLEYLDCKYHNKEINYDSLEQTEIRKLNKIIREKAMEFDNARKLSDDDCKDLINHYCEQYSLGYNNSQKIKRILVDGLFGYNSYKFEFNSKDNLAIILGTNGLGKTMMFKLLEALVIRPKNKKVSKDNLDLLFDTPFKQFRVDFYDHSQIKVLKKSKDTINISYEHRAGQGGFDAIMDVNLNRDSLDKLDRHYTNVYSLFSRINDYNKFLFIKVNRVNDLDSIRNNLYESFTKNNEHYFSNNFDQIFKDACFPNLVLDFENKIKESLRKYKYLYDKSKRLNKNVILFKENEKKYKQFIKEFKIANIKDDLTIKKVKDIEEYAKYEDFNDCVCDCYDLVHKYHLFKDKFKEFYNDFDPSRKEILYKNQSLFIKCSNGNILPFDKLSSGELNLASLIYNLVFNADDSSIVLIDEPEVSLHIAWQQQISDLVLELIEDKQDMQVIIATHSPFVSSGHDDLLSNGYYLEDDDLE